MVPVDWRGMVVQATVPNRIAAWVPELSIATVRRTERAAAEVRRSADRIAGGLEAAARMLLRAEGLASSAIEGLRASAADVALAEAAAERRGSPEGDVSAWVADNLAVVTDALGHDGALDEVALFDLHRRLMRNSPTIELRHVGCYRDTLGWVGGSNPKVAAHVAAPPELIGPAMADLLAFAAREDVDAVTSAAVLHAQFETIHPFADGNGRLGRVLVGSVLARRLGVSVPPPVSLQMARDVGGYQSGLTLFRQGDVDAWVSWFADAVADAAERSGQVLDAVGALQETWRVRLADVRADAAAHALVGLLPGRPVLSAASAASLVGVSRAAAGAALAQLGARGIVVEVADRSHRPGRPRRWWVASELLDLLGR